MRITALGLGALALAVSSGGAARAGSLWTANMTGANEVPPHATDFSGRGFLVLNNAETAASVTATHNIPASQLSAGHVHRGPPGVVGPIILPFPNPASPVGPIPWAIPAADVANLKAGNLYMNFHTPAFPVGVIRDQFSRVEFSSSAATSSQRAVAGALDVSAGFNADLDQALFAMTALPASGRAAALQDLGGDTIYAQGRQATESMQRFQESLLQHLQTAPPQAEGVSVFGALDAEWGRRNTRDGQAGSNVTRQFLLGGVQYAWPSGQAAGLAIGYANGKDKFRGGRGETEADTTSLQGFFTTGRQFRLTVVGGYGWTGFDTQRNLVSFAQTARSSHDGSVWGVAAKLSAPRQVATNMTVSPYVQIDHQGASIDGYVENGAGGLGLVVPEHNYDNTATELGASLAIPFGSQSGAWTARVQAGWRHLLDDGEETFPLAFIGSPVAFDQQILGAGRDAAHLDVSITGALGPRATISGGYRGYVGGQGSDAHAIQLRFNYAM